VEAGPRGIAASFRDGARTLNGFRIERDDEGDALRWSDGRLIQNTETKHPEDRLAAIERVLAVVEDALTNDGPSS
jgi:hypothetical protein